MTTGKSVQKVLEKGLSNHKQRVDALTRIDTLEARLDNLHTQLNNAFKQQGEKMDNIVRVLDALTNIIGEEAVTTKVRERHVEKLEAEAAQTEEAVNAAVESGNLVHTDEALGEEYLVVTTQKNADGSVRHPTKLFLPLGGYVPEVKALLEKAKVGDVIPLEDTTTIEIIDILKPVAPQTPPENLEG